MQENDINRMLEWFNLLAAKTNSSPQSEQISSLAASRPWCWCTVLTVLTVPQIMMRGGDHAGVMAEETAGGRRHSYVSYVPHTDTS